MHIDRTRIVLAAACALFAAPAQAHGDAHDPPKGAPAAHGEQTPFGIAGDSAKVTRTIRVDMTDTMRFTPSAVSVRRGETVRFALANRGAQMHEMVIGTAAGLAEHAALMRRFPEMEHADPWMAHVRPGAAGEIVWRFNRAGNFQFACLLPGHFEAGMLGTITVK